MRGGRKSSPWPAASLSASRPRACRSSPRRVYVGDGAVRYRDEIVQAGGVVPPDDADEHVPWARHHASLARDFGPGEAAEPIYLRLPDAERALSR